MTTYFFYILRSLKDLNYYTGYTIDFERRLNQHNNGQVTSTKNRIPFELVYFEGCFNEKDALHREKYLKSTYGKRYIRNRLKNYLN